MNSRVALLIDKPTEQKDLEQRLGVPREAILKIAAKHGAINVRVFGSFIYGTEKPDSDVDFLVQLAPDCSLLDQVALIQDLTALLGRRVDVVEPEGLHWSIRDKVLAEAVPI